MQTYTAEITKLAESSGLKKSLWAIGPNDNATIVSRRWTIVAHVSHENHALRGWQRLGVN